MLNKFEYIIHEGRGGEKNKRGRNRERNREKQTIMTPFEGRKGEKNKKKERKSDFCFRIGKSLSIFAY